MKWDTEQQPTIQNSRFFPQRLIDSNKKLACIVVTVCNNHFFDTDRCRGSLLGVAWRRRLLSRPTAVSAPRQRDLSAPWRCVAPLGCAGLGNVPLAFYGPSVLNTGVAFSVLLRRPSLAAL